MAAEGDATKDLKAHQGTYAAFTGLMKWGAILCVIVALIVIMVIRK
ncbi:MAG: aa3-type cytochrome c oxidase subunit IV [Sphingomonadaceae bacterium]|nr:aa3-type cytochrome c oxidase subunit IV [Sphingomonadaceae bacterium]